MLARTLGDSSSRDGRVWYGPRARCCISSKWTLTCICIDGAPALFRKAGLSIANAAARRPAANMETQTRHSNVVSNGIRLHLAEAGSGKPVILLHGFPEFWYSWRFHVTALAEAGFHALAPDMRGYNLSEKPHGVAAYGIDELVADVAGLVDYCGNRRAHLVGHDWGGIVAWYAAMRRPELFDRLVVLNAPHPGAYLRDRFSTKQWIQ